MPAAPARRWRPAWPSGAGRCCSSIANRRRRTRFRPSDAIEQALHVAEALTGPGENLSDYEAWRDERAREHYEWSFDYSRLPRPGITRPIFAGLASDPEAGQGFRDTFTRLARPRSDVLTRERLERWFAATPAGVG